MKTILLKLSGPLQSWGVGSRFETRDSGKYPSKSALIGLLGACAGFSREDDEKIQTLNELDFVVRIDQTGRIKSDFHTAHKYKDNGALERIYVTDRYYLQDAVFVVGLSSSNNELIDMLTKAIRYPFYAPYLGRRSLPINADFYLGVSDGNALENILSLPLQTKSSENSNRPLDIYADSHLLSEGRKFMVQDVPKTFSQKRRRHDFRSVTHIRHKIMNDEHNIFDAIGGTDVLK